MAFAQAQPEFPRWLDAVLLATRLVQLEVVDRSADPAAHAVGDPQRMGLATRVRTFERRPRSKPLRAKSRLKARGPAVLCVNLYQLDLLAIIFTGRGF